MASATPAAEKASDLMQKLSLETKTKTNEAPAVTKKNPAMPASNRSLTPVLQNVDPNMYYYSNGYTSPYYFGGHDGMSDWGDYSRYVGQDGVEMTTGLYGDIYGYGYSPYGAYSSPASPVPTVGQDGQLYSPQHYQYPAPYFQPPSPAPYNPPTQNSTSKAPSTSSSEQTPLTLDASKVKGNGAVPNGTANSTSNGSLLSTQKISQQSSLLTPSGTYNRSAGTLANGFSSYDAMRSPSPWYDGSTNNGFSSNGSAHAVTGSATLGRNQSYRSFSNNLNVQNQRPTSGIGSATSMMMNRMYPNNRLYNAYAAGLGQRSSFYDSRANRQWGYVDTKYKPGTRGNGYYGYPNESLDGLSELNRGPRANRTKNPKPFVPTVTVASKEQTPLANGNSESSTASVPDKDQQYNKEDFPAEYSDAKFFVIKSYSEDDVHKSVKYNVWASTPNGNKKLDAAYREAKEKAAACPIFLFFSVNTSGQFVGVAEMVGPVDFNKNVDYWQQDKWTGCFSVKWHIVKDVPNTILKHIILANNENKPVTNSRDTQEVKLEQGLQMIKLFKEHVNKTSILDDFAFYETRQKVMQEKRAKQQHLVHKPVVVTKPLDIEVKNKEGDTEKSNFLNPNDKITILKANSVGLGDVKPNEGNNLAQTAENMAVANVS